MDRPAQIYRTEPPDVAARSLKRRIGEKMSTLLMPFIRLAARPYLGGETVEDACCVATRLADEGFLTALSYWDGGRESLEQMESISLAAIAAAGKSYLSLKPPALRFSGEAARLLAKAAAARQVRLHFDSHGADAVDAQNAMLEAMLETLPPALIGTTIPGRLKRSLQDADWAVARGINIRVVKGEWPDPAAPQCDLAVGYLAAIDRLAGRARCVSVATHNFALGREAVGRLRAAATPCEVEVLLGMPARPLIAWAKDNGVPVRVYVPYGTGFIVNAVGVLRRNPRLALSIAKARLSDALHA
jgi:proline dehydrogenase